MAAMFRQVSPVAASALLAACAAAGSYPSLAPRPAEKAASTPAAAPSPAPTAVADADPAVAKRLIELKTQARAGQREFEKALPEARSESARAGAAGSESWIAAQETISRLEAARSPTTVALAELDALARGEREADTPAAAADLEAIGTAEAEVRALADRQDSEISALSGSLAEP